MIEFRVVLGVITLHLVFVVGVFAVDEVQIKGRCVPHGRGYTVNYEKPGEYFKGSGYVYVERRVIFYNNHKEIGMYQVWRPYGSGSLAASLLVGSFKVQPKKFTNFRVKERYVEIERMPDNPEWYKKNYVKYNTIQDGAYVLLPRDRVKSSKPAFKTRNRIFIGEFDSGLIINPAR